MHAHLVALVALATLFTTTANARQYRICSELYNRVDVSWPKASQPMPKPYRCFAGQTPVRVYNDRSDGNGSEKPIANVRTGDYVLSMAYVNAGGSTVMVPCWDRVMATHHSVVPDQIQTVAVDVGPSTRYRFYSFTSPDHPFLAHRAISPEPEGKLDLVWVPAMHLKSQNRLVSLDDANRSTNSVSDFPGASRPYQVPAAPIASSVPKETTVYISAAEDPHRARFDRDRFALSGGRIQGMVTLTTETTHNFFVKGIYHPSSADAGDCAYYLVHNKL